MELLNKLFLPKVTLLCTDCVNTERAIRAIEICLQYASFGSVKLLTSLPTDYKYAQKIRFIHSVKEYSRFMIQELWQYIDNDYCLVIQYDGYILNPKAWDDNWYNYDYVGGNDYWTGVGPDGVGGNGGFSFRSKRLHLALKDNLTELNKISRRGRIYSEDMYISRDCAGWFKEHGYKIATRQVQQNFGISSKAPGAKWEGQFGFHHLEVDRSIHASPF